MIFQNSRIYFFRDTFLHFYLHFWLFLRKILNGTKFHKIDKELLQNPHHLFSHRKSHEHKVSGKTFLPFCSSQGLRTLESDAPGCHPAGAHQSNKQNASDHTGASAWDVHPYKSFLSPILEIHMNQDLQDWAQSVHLHQNTCAKTWLQPSISVILNT